MPSDFDRARDDVDLMRHLARSTRYDRSNRLALLTVHAMFGLAVGGCFLVYGVPVGWRTSIGDTALAQDLVILTPIAGALILALGLILGRHLLLEALGMSVLLLWEVVGVVVVIRWIKLEDPGPLQYQVALYGAPALLMAVHLATLVRYLRDNTPRSGHARG